VPAPSLPHPLPITDATVLEMYGHLFAPWVKELGLRDFRVGPGEASALLPQADALKLYAGAVCGQAVMAAIDTVVTLAMFTTDRLPKGTVYQHTHFLRPAAGSRLTLDASGDLVAHASSEFAF